MHLLNPVAVRNLRKAVVEDGAVEASTASVASNRRWNKVAGNRNPSQPHYRTYRPFQGRWSGGKTIAAAEPRVYSSKWFRRLTATEITDVFGSVYAKLAGSVLECCLPCCPHQHSAVLGRSVATSTTIHSTSMDGQEDRIAASKSTQNPRNTIL